MLSKEHIRFMEAEEKVGRDLIAVNPNNAEAWRIVAHSRMMRCDYVEATRAIGTSLSLEPASPNTLDLLKTLVVKMGLIPDMTPTAEDCLASQRKLEAEGRMLRLKIDMLRAFKFFSKKTKSETLALAGEISAVISEGITPTGSYRLRSFPNEEFTGDRLIAYLYVAQPIVFPEDDMDYGEPFDEAFVDAHERYKAEGWNAVIPLYRELVGLGL